MIIEKEVLKLNIGFLLVALVNDLFSFSLFDYIEIDSISFLFCRPIKINMNTLKKIVLRVFLGITLIFCLFIGLVIVPYFANIVMPWDRANAIETALTWGGLTEIPEDADIISVNTEGNMFTRAFLIEFESNQKAIDKWVSESNGLKGLIPTTDPLGRYIYKVKGYEGSMGGTVKVDVEKSIVIIMMSWS